MPGYTYKPKEPPIPKGCYRSYLGGYERTKLAGYAPGATVTDIKRDQSDDARRARIRARKREEKTDLEVQLEATLAALDALEEANATREFHNGG